MACHSKMIPGIDQTATGFFKKSENEPVDYFQAATEANGADKFGEVLDPVLENDGDSQKKRRKRKLKNITLSHLEPYYDVPLETAAKLFGVGRTTFRNYCRELGMSEWPYKKRNVSSVRDQLREIEHFVMDIDSCPQMDYEFEVHDQLGEIEHFLMDIDTCPEMDYEFEAAGNHPALEKIMQEFKDLIHPKLN